MNILLDLLNNATLLISIVMLHGVLMRQLPSDSRKLSLLSGLLFGTAAILGMSLSVEMIPGVLIDSRSLVLSMAGLFGGPVVAGMAAIMAALYRTSLGGTGVAVGIAVIVTTSALGVAGYYLRKSARFTPGWKSLYLFGLVVHLTVLVCLLALPVDVRWQVLDTFAVPMMVVYPVATVLFGLLLLLVEDSIQSHRDLQEINSQLLNAEANAHIGHWWLEPETFKAYWANEIYHILGITPELPPGLETLKKCVHPDDWGELQASLMRSLNQGDRHQQQYRVLRPNGEVRWVDCRGKSVCDEKGQILRVVGTFQDVTETILGEQAARHAEDRLNKAQAVGHLGSWEYDIASGRIWGSYEAFLIYGMEPPPSNEMPIDEIEACIPEKARVHQALVDLLESGKPYELEFVIQPRQGPSEKIISSRAELIRDDRGNPLKVLGVIQDITQRKARENKIEAQQVLLGAILENTGDAIVACDEEGRLSLFNRAARALHQAKERPIGATEWTQAYDLYLADGVTRMQPEQVPLFQALQGQTVRELEMVVAPPEGEAHSLLATGSPVIDAAGNSLGAVVSMHDITERKRTEDQIKRTNLLLDEMGSIAKIGGWELDLVTMEPSFTEETFRIHELSSRQVPKLEDGIAYYAPESRPLVEKVVRQAIEKNQPYDIEVPFITAKGRNIWVRTQGKAYYENGKAVRLFGSIQDITERKLIENELRASHEHLEQQIEQRTAELSRANQHLLELDQLKSLFIASMSHELRTPLNSIIGFTGMMLQEIPGPIVDKQRDYLTRVANAGRHLLSLISDVIDIAKVEAGKAQAYVEHVDLANLVREATEQIRNEAANKGLSLEVSVPEGMVIATDRRRLLQCLLNYLSNAIKYTRQGGITLRVSESEGDASELEIAVSDTGIGIAAADQDRLFRQFSRIDSDITRQTAGTGLGLYLTRKLATDVLGGRVSMDSEPGHGSTFRLYLPREIKT